MNLDDTVKSELTGKTLTLRTYIGYWDKWIVETHRQAERIDEIEGKLNELLALVRANKTP